MYKNLLAALDVFHFERVHYSYYNMRYSCLARCCAVIPRTTIIKEINEEFGSEREQNKKIKFQVLRNWQNVGDEKRWPFIFFHLCTVNFFREYI